MNHPRRTIGDYLDNTRLTAAHPFSSWGGMIRMLWAKGVREIMKMPVVVDETGNQIPKPLKRRPIGCPEPAGPTEFFSLVWFDGAEWTWGDGLFLYADRTVLGPLRFHCNYTFGQIASEEALQGRIAARENQKMRIFEEAIGDSPFVRSSVESILAKSKGEVAETDVVELIWRAVEWARYRKVAILGGKTGEDEYLFADFDGDHWKRLETRCDDEHKNISRGGENGDWADILSFAMDRHGRELGAQALAEAMGAKLEELMIPHSKDPRGSLIQLRQLVWSGNIRIDLDVFSDVHRKWRKEHPLGNGQEKKKRAPRKRAYRNQ